MSTEPDPSPTPRAVARGWRWGTPAVFGLCGILFAVSAQNSAGTDLRPTRYTDIASIVAAESAELNELNARAAELDAEVKDLTAAVKDRTVNRYNRQIDTLEDPAGFTPRSGPAVTVVLDDAPADLIASTSRDLNDLVVHQQDIQAVVNAMWSAGAEAVTIQGQRVISTTGIKCSGNTVQLQGFAYSPPYVITAIGDQVDLLAAIQDDDYLGIYREYAADPDVRLGWDVRVEDFATAPAYDGIVNLDYAVPIRS